METADSVADGPRPVRRPPWLGRVLVESVLIVFSVLVALAVDEWRDERALRSRSREAIAAITAEINANKIAAQNAKDTHQRIHDDLAALPPDADYKAGLFQPARLLQTAWVTARDTGSLAPLPLEAVLELSRLYERQAIYMALSNEIVTDTFVDLRRRGLETVLRESRPGFGALTREFQGREQGLIEAYDAALKTLASLPQ